MTLNAPHLLHVVRGEVDARLRNLRMSGDWGEEGGRGGEGRRLNKTIRFPPVCLTAVYTYVCTQLAVERETYTTTDGDA